MISIISILNSVFIIMIPMYFIVNSLQNKNYTIEQYTLIAPLYLMIVGMFTLYYKIPFFITGILSGVFVSSIAYYFTLYNFKNREKWIIYVLTMIVLHSIIFKFIQRDYTL